MPSTSLGSGGQTINTTSRRGDKPPLLQGVTSLIPGQKMDDQSSTTKRQDNFITKTLSTYLINIGTKSSPTQKKKKNNTRLPPLKQTTDNSTTTWQILQPLLEPLKSRSAFLKISIENTTSLMPTGRQLNFISR